MFRMDVEVSAGRDSTWRRAAAATANDDGAGGGGGGGGVMEAQVVPLELYDCARAKIDANLRWLFAKAYGTGKTFSCAAETFLDVKNARGFISFYMDEYFIVHFVLVAEREKGIYPTKGPCLESHLSCV